ncbi:MAG: beta-galactosidase [Armatimonadota bacterium]
MLRMVRHILSISVLSLFGAVGCIAQPVAVFSPGTDEGASIIPPPDGPCQKVSLAGKDAIMSINDGRYLYVQVSPGLREKAGSDVYLVIEFYDKMLAQFQIEYNAADNRYKKGPIVRTGASGKWVKALVNLKDAKFQGTQNGGTDFRFAFTDELAISRIEVYSSKPDVDVPSDEERALQVKASVSSLPKNGKAGNGMRYVFGDNSIEVTSPEQRFESPFGCNRDDTTIKLYKSLGATSVETYVTWETCEKEGYNKWDWTLWDRQLKVLKDNRMKWTPFLILGPAYSTPDWFRASKDHFPCRCLEHGTDSKVESLWNPNLPKWIKRFVGEFAKRYGNTGTLESVLIGIQGDYGESIYSVFGGWTQLIPGDYHAHGGFWCDDPYALADYRKFMQKKFVTIDKLNGAWGTAFKDFGSLDFPGRGDSLAAFRKDVEAGKAPARRQWLDFLGWYRASMTRFSDWWLAETKKQFPNIPVYLCTGGSGQPEHGSDFAEQCRVAAKNKCGVRITNEGPGYQWNHVLTRWVASAGRHYGANFGFEPASNIDLNTIPGRFFNAVVSGCDHLHDYSRNIIGSSDRIDAQRKAFKQFKYVPKPLIPVAQWYPNVALSLDHGPQFGKFSNASAKLLDYIDHDYLDETMLRSKALRNYRILVILSGEVMETADARLIADWAKSGGTVIVMGVNQFQSVEFTPDPESILFGANPDGGTVGKGKIIRVSDWTGIASALRQTMQKLGLPIFDLKEDNLYTARTAPGELLYLNTAPTPVTTEIIFDGKTITRTIPPGGISKVTFTLPAAKPSKGK